MGCPGSCNLEDNLVFSICCHDPDTGVLTDADAAPAYRVYADETATPLLTGTMAVLDDVNTTGFYTELIACTAANGFEIGKSYTVYISATVDSDIGGISYGFKIVTIPTAAEINAEVVDALATDTYAEPGQGAPSATTSLAAKINYLYKFLRNKVTNDGTDIKVYNDAGTVIDHKSSVSEAAGTVTRGEFGTGA